MRRKTLRGVASDLEYLHKDFHGALSYAVEYVEERFGRKGLNEFLRRVARSVYGPLIRDIKQKGLRAMQKHCERIFTGEGAQFRSDLKEDELVLHVTKCPAIHHMQERGYKIAPHFCETTRIVNETIAKESGCESSVRCDRKTGACIQRFRKRKKR